MKGAHSKWAAVFLTVAVAALALVATRLPQAVPRAYAQEQPSPEEAKDRLQQAFSQAIALFEEGKLPEAKVAFEGVRAMAKEWGVTLGERTQLTIAEHLEQIEAELAKAEPPEEEEAAEAEAPAEVAEPSEVEAAEPGPTPEQQARMTQLEEQYARAVELHQAGKLEEAKAVFHAVAAAGAREHLTLDYETEAGLRRYVGRIDDDIAEAERERQAALVAEEAARKAAAEEEARRATAEAEARGAAARVEAEAAAKAGAEEKLAEAARKQQIAAEKAHREAAALYQQAMELIRQDQRDAALLKLERAVGIDPTLADAQQALSDLRKEMGLISPEERLFEEEVRIETVRHGRAAREMDQSLIQAQELIDEHEYDEALKVLRRVATKAEVGDYPASMKREYAKGANGLIAKADKEKAGYEAALEDRRRKEAEAKAGEAARYQRELRARQIKELFRQAEDMYMSQRFGEAESAVRAILSLDPDNGEAKVMLDQIDRGRSRQVFLELSEQRAREYREHWEATQEASRIQGERETIVYPDDWKTMSLRREKMLATLAPEVSAAEAVVRDKLRRQVTFNFADTPLKDVADFLRRVGDVNIVVDQEVLAAAGPGGPRVTLALTDVPLEDALDFILDVADLDWVIRRGVVFISDVQGVQADAFMHIYDIRDLVGTVTDFAGPTFDLEADTGGGDGFDFEDDEDAEDISVFVSASQSGDDVAALIQENVARETWGLGGQNSIVYRDGSLIVRNTTEVHEEIQRLLAGLRQARALQVTMDIRFIRATDDFVVDVSAGITDASYDRSHHTLSWSAKQDLAVAVGTTRHPFRTNPLTTTPGPVFALAGSILDSLMLDYYLEAVEGSDRGILLSAPRLTVFNGQRAYIAVMTQRNLVTDIDVDVAESAIGYDIDVETITTGVVFDVRPIVSADRRYVQMELRPSRSELIEVTPFNVGIVLIPGVGGPDTIQQLTVQLPVVETTEVRTTVSVPDGGTLMVGGLKFTFEQELEHGVPILSQIPIINRLITRTASVREKDNLIILVTPHIIIQEELEAMIR